MIDETAQSEIQNLSTKIRHAQSPELRFELRATRRIFTDYPTLFPRQLRERDETDDK